MKQDLFGDVSQPSVHIGSNRKYVLGITISAYVSGFVMLAIVTLTSIGVLPPVPLEARAYTFVKMADIPLPPLPKQPSATPPMAKPTPAVDSRPFVEVPTVGIPDEPKDLPGLPEPLPPGLPFGPVGNPTPLPPGDFVPVPEKPVAKPELSTPPVPFRPRGEDKQPVLIKRVSPLYPSIAQSARVQGVVVIEAVIDANGRVSDARVLRSIPLLDQSAIDAVKQWEYTPTILNGRPVPVIITVTVIFKL